MEESKCVAPPDQCHGIVSVLEGGYDLLGLGRCAVAHIKALAKIQG
jgi:acetoin utilization deacetylase AcuC-like enzyme